MISNFTNLGRYELNRPHPEGFAVRRTLFSSENSSGENSTGHIIQLNQGMPFSFSRKSQGILTTGICETENIVQLLSPGKNHFLCDQEYCAIEVLFDAWFIDKILEKENFRFQDHYNFNDPLLSGLITELYKTAYSHTAEKLYIESLVITSVTHLATTYSLSNRIIFSLKGKLSSTQLRRVIAFVRESINRTVTLEELAICCHLSVFHFSRLFKNTIGISPYQYVLRSKIEHARDLIKYKRAIGEIAYSLGFTDSAHFCNTFKRLTGHSPLQYAISVKTRSYYSVYPYANSNG